MIETLFVTTLYFGYLRYIRRNESKVDKILRELSIFDKSCSIIFGAIVGISLGYLISWAIFLS